MREGAHRGETYTARFTHADGFADAAGQHETESAVANRLLHAEPGYGRKCVDLVDDDLRPLCAAKVVRDKGRNDVAKRRGCDLDRGRVFAAEVDAVRCRHCDRAGFYV